MTRQLSTLARRAGRTALWLVLVLLLVRGAADLVASSPPAIVLGPPQPSDHAFPDEEALAFAVSFARAYLSFTPGHEAEHAQGLVPYLVSGLDEHAGLVVPEKGVRQEVVDANAARVHATGDEKALLTLAVTLEPSRTLYLAVPVARDPYGRLAVVDLPALAAPPTRSLAPLGESGEPLSPGGRTGIEALLRRFFPAYLGGSPGELAYFLRPGARIEPIGGPWREVALLEVSALEPPGPRALLALATVRARDELTGALLSLRFRVSLVQEGRWYVAAINDAKERS